MVMVVTAHKHNTNAVPMVLLPLAERTLPDAHVPLANTDVVQMVIDLH